MNILKLSFIFLLFVCQASGQQLHFKAIAIDTAYSFRGLSVVDDSVAWVSGIKGVVGRSTNGGHAWTFKQVKDFEKKDFRTLYAFNAQEAVIANAGSPACVLRTADGGKNWSVVYTNKDSAAFFDGIDFWNDQEGIIYGDPIQGRMLLLKTTDGGKTWQELPLESRPQMAEGEASFAASGTGIRCGRHERVVIATGGKRSRLFTSGDGGKNWTSREMPIIQGRSSTGIFSFAFSDCCPDGIIVGGDYLNDTLKQAHVFYTPGKDWKAPITGTGGYRECVEMLDENGMAIAVGPGGSDLTVDGGKNWKPLGYTGFHVIRKARKGKLVLAAGNKRISIVQSK